jgi:hypothetical protein
MIYTKIHTHLRCLWFTFYAEIRLSSHATIGSVSYVPIYTVTSSFVDALITVVCGPT